MAVRKLIINPVNSVVVSGREALDRAEYLLKLLSRDNGKIDDTQKTAQEALDSYYSCIKFNYEALDNMYAHMKDCLPKIERKISPSQFNEKTMGKLTEVANVFLEGAGYARNVVKSIENIVTKKENVDEYLENSVKKPKDMLKSMEGVTHTLRQFVTILDMAVNVVSVMDYSLEDQSVKVAIADMTIKGAELFLGAAKEFDEKLTEEIASKNKKA